ncbi:MAG: hypothetical protein IKN16_04360, partial [Selenomonadaceae bacterium]|nr:hypothetical protein [Selenomonadaceae bacterium]
GLVLGDNGLSNSPGGCVSFLSFQLFFSPISKKWIVLSYLHNPFYTTIFKTWLEFSYKNYSHGKFLLSEKIPNDEPISAFLRTRLNKNRQHLLTNPQDLKQYIPTGKTIRADDLLHQVKLESTFFLSVMDDFE